MIACIVVLYNPNKEHLKISIDSLLPQIDKLILVDNSVFTNNVFTNSKINYITLNKNLGIAKAQNIGIKYLTDNYPDDKYVVFSDQDSILSENVIKELKEGYLHLKSNNFNVGAVGTRAINERTNLRYKSNSKEVQFFPKKEIRYTSDITEVVSLRSSVSLMELKIFLEVGFFDEDLFIDGVDHEWCWRSNYYYNYKYFIIEDAIINHNLGEGDRKIGFYKFSFPSSIRLYYQYRNYLRLIKRKYVPKNWKVKHLFKYTLKFFYFSLIHENKKDNFKYIIKGIKDGIKSK